MVRYLNTKNAQGIETIDELSSNDFSSLKEFFNELKRLKQEYSIAGIPCYTSQRACKNWK